MPSLSMSAWVRFEPAIPGNLDLPQPERFFLELPAGLPKVRLAALAEEMRSAADRTQLAASIAAVIRLGSVPLVLDGAPVSSPQEYLEAIIGQAGTPLLEAMQDRLLELNSFGGARELFSGRPSGGTGTTPDPNAAQKTDVR